MTNSHTARALRPVGSEPGALLPASADRRLATEHWLLSTLDPSGRDRARTQWQEWGIALLPLGALFSAVRIPGRLVVALTASTESSELDAFLDQALEGGPVICDPHGHRYYALVPASMPVTWHQAADEWRAALDVDCLGNGTDLGVPKVNSVELNPKTRSSYWSVPMSSAEVLCAPLNVARLIAAGRHQLVGEPEE